MRGRGTSIKRGSTLAVGVIALAGLAAPAGAGHDRTPPQTAFIAGPGARTTDTTPKFRFRSNEANSSFVCKRDGKRFKPCRSPKTLSPLTYGRHGFYVKAIDAFGNVDPTAAAYVFKVARK